MQQNYLQSTSGSLSQKETITTTKKPSEIMVFVIPIQGYFCLLCISLQSDSSTRCLLLERLLRIFIRFYKVIFKKQDININKITF